MAREEQWKRSKEVRERKLALAVFVAAGGDVSLLRKENAFNPSSNDQVQAQAGDSALPSLRVNNHLKTQPDASTTPSNVERIRNNEASKGGRLPKLITVTKKTSSRMESKTRMIRLSRNRYLQLEPLPDGAWGSPGGGLARIEGLIAAKWSGIAHERYLSKPKANKLSKRESLVSLHCAHRTPLCSPEFPMGETFRLVWTDYFDYTGTLSTARWECQLDANEWVHDDRYREAQWYTDKLENVSVKGGRLCIVARAEAYCGCSYTSARIRTKNRGDWQYGRVEVRAKLPQSRRGIWPAIWMLPTNETYSPWPHSRESA